MNLKKSEIDQAEWREIERAGLLKTLIAMVMLSAHAFCGTVELSFVGIEAGGSQGNILNGSDESRVNGSMVLQTRNAEGELASLVGEMSWVYCYELTSWADYDYNVYNVGTLASSIGSDKAGLISQLWAQNYDEGWQSGSYIYEQGWEDGEPADTAENCGALALSFSIYEIIYDYDGTLESLDLSANAYRADAENTNPAGSVAIAESWLNSLLLPENYSGPSAELLSLSNDGHQDFIMAVPEPITLGIMGFGALLLIHRRKA